MLVIRIGDVHVTEREGAPVGSASSDDEANNRSNAEATISEAFSIADQRGLHDDHPVDDVG